MYLKLGETNPPQRYMYLIQFKTILTKEEEIANQILVSLDIAITHISLLYKSLENYYNNQG